MIARSVFSPSGGIFYHWSAFRYRKLWQPFCRQVARWLDEWAPPARELVIFGPSVGYTLSDDFLLRFNRVIAVEPDPFARWLFRRRFRHQRTRLELISDECLLWKPRAWRQKLPNDAAFLFSNILGQVNLIRPPDLDVDRWQSDVIEALDLVESWASYHDVVSIKLQSERQRPHDSLMTLPPSLTSDEGLHATLEFYFSDAIRLSEKPKSRLHESNRVAIDHDTHWLHSASHGQSIELFPWQIRPHQTQICGFQRHSNSS